MTISNERIYIVSSQAEPLICTKLINVRGDQEIIKDCILWYLLMRTTLSKGSKEMCVSWGLTIPFWYLNKCGSRASPRGEHLVKPILLKGN